MMLFSKFLLNKIRLFPNLCFFQVHATKKIALRKKSILFQEKYWEKIKERLFIEEQNLRYILNTHLGLLDKITFSYYSIQLHTSFFYMFLKEIEDLHQKLSSLPTGFITSRRLRNYKCINKVFLQAKMLIFTIVNAIFTSWRQHRIFRKHRLSLPLLQRKRKFVVNDDNNEITVKFDTSQKWKLFHIS